MDGLRTAISVCGGQTGLASRLGVRQGHVWAWLHRTGVVPAEHVIPIVRATSGAVTPYQLRPDIYPDPDWMPPDVEPPEEAA